MSRPTLQTPKRSDRRALVAGAVASAVVHGILFAPVTFDVPRPAAGDLPERAAVLADDALQLIVLRETLRPQIDSEPSEPRPEAGPAEASSGAAAPAAPPNAASPATPAGARAASPPPVLLAYAAPVRSPLLMAAPAYAGSARAEDAAAESVAETTAAAATYTPGGVRSAKLGWSGQDAAKARRDKRSRSALAVDVGGGHCPARPPSRGPLGL